MRETPQRTILAVLALLALATADGHTARAGTTTTLPRSDAGLSTGGARVAQSVTVLFESPSPVEPSLRVAGTPRSILESRPVARPSGGPGWRALIYFDPVLAEGGALEPAGEMLAARARSLAGLGSIEIIVADPFAESWLEASSDPDEILDTLEWAVEELAPWDEEDDPGRGIDLQPDEVTERIAELISWLALQEGAGPRCLWLPISAEVWRIWSARAQETGSWLATVAALGWTVVPVAVGPGSSASLPTLDEMASVTGGLAVTNGAGMGRALALLGNARQLVFPMSSTDLDAPVPLEIQAGSTDEVRAPAWVSVAAPEGAIRLRTRRFLEAGGRESGSLPVVAAVVQGSAGEGWGGGTLEVLVKLGGHSSPVFAISALIVRVGGEEILMREVLRPSDLAGKEAWLYRRGLEDFESIDGVAVTVEELESGAWGLTVAELSAVSLEEMPGGVSVHSDAPSPPRARGSQAPVAPEATAIRILPPKRRPIEGPTRFQTLLSDLIVDKVEFYLDGKLVETDDNRPFSATLDLGEKPRNRIVSAVAYDRQDRRLGGDSLTINPLVIPFEVRITDLSGEPEQGAVDVASQISVPEDAALDRVEFYWNETLLATLDAPPFEARITSDTPGLNDYVRVVAVLADGTTTEDARLLSERGVIERLEVNLVQLNVVVSDRSGEPVKDLAAEDFEIRFGGETRPVDRFALADEVPLLLGLLVDTSGSMEVLMNDTKKAGARFLSESLRPGDRAFLVDFDTRPRLVHPTTDDLVSLMNRFVRLEAEGYTALYDAVIFSLLQFEEEKGRKALVMLTDGYDVGSKYGPRRCISYGRRFGVPLYILSLAGIYNPRGGLKRIDLDSLTESTGGRSFYITDTDQLTEAYAKIDNELRSQYVLGFSTERPLEEEELGKIQVKVGRKGLKVRAVVGSQQID